MDATKAPPPPPGLDELDLDAEFDEDDLEDEQLAKTMRAELNDEEMSIAIKALAPRLHRHEQAKLRRQRERLRKSIRLQAQAEVTVKYTTIPTVNLITGTARNVTSTFLRRNAAPTSAAGAAAASASAPVDDASLPDPGNVGKDVLVINPGSRFLRIGLASDPLPRTVPHVIARRLRARVPVSVSMLHELEPSAERDQELSLIDGLLRERLRGLKRKHNKDLQSQVTQYNSQQTPENVPEQADPMPVTWTWVDEEKTDVFIGEEALRLSNYANFRLLFPVKHGRLNVDDVSSMQVLLADLEELWTRAIEKELRILRKDFRGLSVVLVLPESMDRAHAKEIVGLLLQRMGFSAVLLHLESVCATFGAGMSYSCVVDVGAQKTTVSCVDDGLVQAGCKLTMPYGGDDITRLFTALMRAASFPFADLRLTNVYDFQLMEALKERHCSLVEEDVVVQLNQIMFVRRPNKPTVRYHWAIFDQSIKATLALFHPVLLGSDLERASQAWTQQVQDAEDYLDEAFIADAPTARTATKSRNAVGTVTRKRQRRRAVKRDDVDQGVVEEEDDEEEDDDEDASDDDVDEDTFGKKRGKLDSDDGPIAPSKNKPWFEADALPLPPIMLTLMLPTPPPAAPAAAPSAPVFQGLAGVLARSSPQIPLHDAILRCIEKLDSEERKKKMISSILLVGGSHLFPGFAQVLRDRILGRIFGTSLADSLSIVTNAKDLDPRILSWKGGAVLARLDGIRDAWITAKDWTVNGPRLFRERTLFEW